jgi:hypothetical protein
MVSVFGRPRGVPYMCSSHVVRRVGVSRYAYIRRGYASIKLCGRSAALVV